MIHIERSSDYALIKAVMRTPAIYRHISDDGSPPADEYRPIESEAIWYLVAWDGNTLLGLWMLVPTNSICFEIHTCLLPHAWGERAHRAAQVMLAWVWENTGCQRIITNVPVDNRLAFHFALNAGMEVYGKNEDSFLKTGSSSIRSASAFRGRAKSHKFQGKSKKEMNDMGLRRIKAPVYVQTPEPGDPDWGIDEGVGIGGGIGGPGIDNSLPGGGGHIWGAWVKVLRWVFGPHIDGGPSKPPGRPILPLMLTMDCRQITFGGVAVAITEGGKSSILDSDDRQ